MTAEIQPRHVAEALAELGRDRVLEAHAYLDAWASLIRSGVPAHAVRHFLDRPHQHTRSTDALDAWGGRTGTLLVVGGRGCGKTHEAARWLHTRHLEGRPGRWLSCSSWTAMSFDAQRAVLDIAARAPALVIDDLGAGGSADAADARKKLNGLLITRADASAPTLVVQNGSTADASQTLDPRLASRLVAAGDLVDVAGPDLRAGERDDVNHPRCPCGHPGKCGHGTRWRDNHEIVEIMGCELIPRATGEQGDGPCRSEWRVGLELVLGANNRRNVRASEALGLRRDDVRELARVKAANDKTPSLQAELEQALLRLAAGQSARDGTIDGIRGLAQAEIGQVRERMRLTGKSYEDALADHEAALAALPLKDMQRRAAGARARADTQARVAAASGGEGPRSDRAVKTGHPWAKEPGPGAQPRATMSSPPPAWTQAEDGRAKMKRFGFEVSGRPGSFRVSYHGVVKLDRLPSKETAWERAALLAGLGA